MPEPASLDPRTPEPAMSFAACLGTLLRRLRTLHGLTQADLGRRTGYDGSYIGATERAAVRPSRTLIERCDHTLQTGGALLTLWPLADREWGTRTTRVPPPTGPALGDRPDADVTPHRPAGAGTVEVAGACAVGVTGAGVAGAGGVGVAGAGGVGVAGAGVAGAGAVGVAGPVAAPPPGTGAGLWAATDPGAGADPVLEAMELARQAEASDLGEEAMAGLERAVVRLQRAALATPPGELIPAVRARRRYAGRLLEGRLPLGRHRRLLVAAGRLSLLLARLHDDAGDREAAEADRDAAFRLACQADHAELAAQAVELLASWALADGRFDDAVALARTGQELAPPATTAAAQLALDEAQALTSLGQLEEAAAAHHLATLTAATLPGPTAP
jgi:hypothetical protein